MLVINNIEVSQNEDGLFSLNDLHKASGGSRKDEVNRFTRSKKFLSEVEFLALETDSQIWVVNKNNELDQGTYVCEDLVYSYAMWVSVEYKFTVIRAFKALVKGDIDTAVKIAVRSVMINKAGSEFDRLVNDDNAVGEKAMNDLCNASDLYKTNASIAGSDLASCRGKKEKRSAAEEAIISRSQLIMTI